jgi:hypothetical protein
MTDPSIHVPILIMAGYLACVIALLVSRRKALRTAALSVVFLLVLVEAFLWKMDGLPMASEVKNYNRDLYSMLSFYDRGRTAFLTKDVSPLTAMPHGISITGGYEQLQLEDYSKIYPQMYLQPPKTWQRLLENNALLSMLNARFLVVSRDIRDPRYIRRYTVQDGKGRVRPLTPGYEDSGSPRYSPIYGRIAAFTSTVLYENLLALPRAYAVMKLKAIDSTDELMRRIFSYRMSPWYEAALSTDDIRQIGHENFSPGDVRIIESRPNSVKLAAEFAGRGFLVLSDQFYPGWNAYIDGIKTRVFKTNAVMRGIVVPAGEHTVVFRYEPNHIYVAMVVSGIIFAGILLLLVRETAR